MLADHHQSRVLLVHPDRCMTGDARRDSSDWCGLVSLLVATRAIFNVAPVLVGECAATRKIVDPAKNECIAIDVDPLAMWQDGKLLPALKMDGTAVLFLGGAWLEEDVLIAAIRAASDGYDVRLLTDMSRLRCEADYSLVAGRATMHAILMVTLRQALLEWAVFTEKEATVRRVRALLG